MLLVAILLAAAAAQDPAAFGSLQLVETAPVEANLDHADLPEAADVWLAMIEGAKTSIDLSHFYVSNEPGKRLEPILGALEAAVARAVKVRLIADLKFVKTYPESLERLEQRGVSVLRIDYAKIGGGVQHAKYMLVDGREAFLGSQNLDWRALEHIQELGLRFDAPELVRALQRVFEHDWSLGSGGQAPVVGAAGAAVTSADGARIEFVASPRGHLAGAEWDLPRIVSAIDSAKQSVCVQLLTYKANAREGGYWEELESALRRAASRRVAVRLLLSDWCKRKGTIEGLQSLEVLPNVDIKLVSLPAWSGGFISFARTIHSKYMVVDGARAWLGTSNWERDYFYQSRNVGLLVEGGALPARLQRVFEDGWACPWAFAVDPCARYEAPRVSDESGR
jgi:phosphatidylserine/phosphatidylglycerophosphate/cardiolipin synthase-like enzyme